MSKTTTTFINLLSTPTTKDVFGLGNEVNTVYPDALTYTKDEAANYFTIEEFNYSILMTQGCTRIYDFPYLVVPNVNTNKLRWGILINESISRLASATSQVYTYISDIHTLTNTNNSTIITKINEIDAELISIYSDIEYNSSIPKENIYVRPTRIKNELIDVSNSNIYLNSMSQAMESSFGFNSDGSFTRIKYNKYDDLYQSINKVNELVPIQSMTRIDPTIWNTNSNTLVDDMLKSTVVIADQLAVVKNNICDYISTSVHSITDDIDTVKELVNNNKTNINDLRNELGDLSALFEDSSNSSDESFSNIETMLNKLPETYATIKSVDDLSTIVAGYGNRITECEENISANVTSIKNANNNINGLINRIDTIDGKIGNNDDESTTTTTIYGCLNDIQSQISALSTRISKLENPSTAGKS